MQYVFVKTECIHYLKCQVEIYGKTILIKVSDHLAFAPVFHWTMQVRCVFV